MHIIKGDMYRDELQWATEECVLVVAAVIPGAPVRFAAPSHGLVDDWPVVIESNRQFSDKDSYAVKVIDSDTLELPSVNGIDFKPGQAVIRYQKPVDMAGYGVRMTIKDKVGGAVLLSSATGDIALTIDNTAKKIHRTVGAGITAAITWKRGTYDVEMYVIADPDDVTKIDADEVTVGTEVTT